mmetsp:Transcript_29808/g.83285  ORF Transcript_29808/g.83285 Transcript_29808/m.83285 type:complete len:303 (+) Transcript_29808:45-953(+)
MGNTSGVVETPAKESEVMAEGDEELRRATDPDYGFQQIKSDLVVREVSLPLTTKATCPEGYIRVVCISDTHSKHTTIKKIPEGDILIHAGDFSNTGYEKELDEFGKFFAGLPHKHKVIIAGNHDLSLDVEDYVKVHRKRFHRNRPEFDAQACRDRFTSNPGYHFLENDSTVIEGLKIHGSPQSPWFCDWAFGPERGPDIQKYWDRIPDDTDILVTHGPPLGYGDLCYPNNNRAGCYNLLRRVERVKPKYHIFGHIHEGYGAYTNAKDDTDPGTIFINASTATYNYRMTNPPIVFDMKKPTDI